MKEGEIRIEWGTVRMEGERYGGWLPVIWINGRQHGDTWGRGLDLEDAELLAQQAALEESARYVGDWKVTILQKKLGARR